MNGDPNQPCQIFQRAPGDRALFINENGSRAWGNLSAGRVYIPDWSDGRGSFGLIGTLAGDRIIWPNGTFWSRGG